MRIVITGHKGQLGRALQDALKGETIFGLDLPEHDITDRQAVAQAIADFNPQVVIHAAAMTNVDGCQRDPDAAYRMNGLGTQNVALACQKCDAAMVYVSTNEVFDGTKGEPYLEFDQTNPVNTYGCSKLAGEFFTRTLLDRFYIVRTAWLYAQGGNNFVSKMVHLADERGELRVVTDEVSSPTYAPDLAEAIAKLIRTDHYGIYHFTNEGVCSRYNFAIKILEFAGRGHVPVHPITSDQYTRPSTPPPYAPIRNFCAATALGITLRPWEEALQAYFAVEQLNASNQKSVISNQLPVSNLQSPISNPSARLRAGFQLPASIIIPNWNGARHLPTCLDSLRRQSYPNFEVIVVDNGSTDGSLELLERDYPAVKVVALPENRGFAGGVNAGIRQAQGEIIAVFNNDAEADPRWLEELAGALTRHPEAGMATPKVLLFDQRDVINTVGDFYGVDGVPGNRGVWQRDEGQFDHEEYVFGAAGVAAAYRRAMLDEVGLFDEDLFSFCEDVDLAWRAQVAGWKCVYVPKAVVYHKLSATGGGRMASYYCGRNFIYVIAKDYPTSLLKKHWRRIVRAQIDIAWEALKAWRGEAAQARLRGQLAGLCGLPRMLAKRRAVQAGKRVTDEYLESILTN